MIDVALDHGGAVQPDAVCMDRALHAAADDQFLGDDIALHVGAVADLDEACTSPST